MCHTGQSFLNFENVNIFYLDKQTGEHTIFKCCKNKCHKDRLKQYIVEQCKSFSFCINFISLSGYIGIPLHFKCEMYLVQRN